MRTGGQGQAAVPRERVCRRRSPRLPGRRVLGRMKILFGLSRLEWSAIREVPVPGTGASGFTMGAFAHMVFFYAFAYCAHGGVSPKK